MGLGFLAWMEYDHPQHLNMDCTVKSVARIPKWEAQAFYCKSNFYFFHDPGLNMIGREGGWVSPQENV